MCVLFMCITVPRLNISILLDFSEVRVELTIRQLYLVSRVEGWHAEVGTAGASEGISQVTTAAAAGEVLLLDLLPTVQLLPETTGTIFVRLPLPGGATHSQ